MTPLLRSPLLAGARGILWREQFLTGVSQSDRLGVPVVASIAGGEGLYRDGVTNLHRITCPALPIKDIRAGHFKSPVRHRAIRIFYIDEKPGMRVGPFEFGNRALQRKLLGRVELRRKTMVRHGRPGAPQQSNRHRTNSPFVSHCFLSLS